MDGVDGMGKRWKARESLLACGRSVSRKAVLFQGSERRVGAGARECRQLAFVRVEVSQFELPLGG